MIFHTDAGLGFWDLRFGNFGIQVRGWGLENGDNLLAGNDSRHSRRSVHGNVNNGAFAVVVLIVAVVAAVAAIIAPGESEAQLHNHQQWHPLLKL